MARNDRSPHQAPDCEYRPEGPTQGEHATALRGFGGDGFSYGDDDPRGRRASRRLADGEAPCDSGEFYGEQSRGGSRDPRSASSVGWGGEGGGLSGAPGGEVGAAAEARRQRMGGRHGGGVLEGAPGHRGRGPRGYLRSDERIAEVLHEALTQDHEIDASEITVLVGKAEVTLTGSVPERGMKHRAEDLASECGGVREVHNHLKVAQSDEGRGESEGGRGR